MIKLLIVSFAILTLQYIKCKGFDDPCWEVKTLDNPSPGYIKMGLNGNEGFWLMDNYGKKQYPLEDDKLNIPMAQKLLKNGLWICYSNFGSGSTIYYLYNQSYQLVDSIPLNSNFILDPHDVEVLSNGHYLLLYLEMRIVDMSKIIDGGSTQAMVMNSVLVETDRSGTEYWQWSALDHLDIMDATQDIDLRMEVIDFAHANAFAEDLDGNIIVSFRHLDEITKINHSTGNIMWRFGGTLCKNNQFTFLNDEIGGFTGFSHQHSVSVTPDGNILLFDNGNLKGYQYSRGVEYQLDTINKRAFKVWEYRNTPDLYTDAFGSCERLPNGNTLVNWAYYKITEVRPDNSIAFEYSYECGPISDKAIYRAKRYITRMNAMTLPVNSAGTYSFNNQKFTTDVSIAASSVAGSGFLTVEKHNYAPPSAIFSDSLFTGILPYRWVLSKTNLNNVSGAFKIKVSGLAAIENPNKLKIYKRDKEASGTFNVLTTSYNAVTQEISANFSGFGEFILASYILPIPIPKEPLNQGLNIAVEGICKWYKTTGATKYQLQVSSASSFSTLITDKTVGTVTEASFSGLKYNTIYYWRVRAFNSLDTSAWSEVFSFTTKQIPEPEIIRPLNTFVGLHTTDSLSWKKVPGAEKYWLQLSPDTGFSVLLIDSGSITKEALTVTNLNYNKTYYWRIKSFQGSNSSQWSKTFCFTTTLRKPELTYPVNDTSNQPFDGPMFWNSVKGAVSYNLEISCSSDFRIIHSSVKGIGSASYEYKNLEPNTLYYWHVRSCRSYDTSAWSDVFKFRTKPAIPVLQKPPQFGSDIPVNVCFSWDSIKTAVSYRLQVSVLADFKKIITDTNGIINSSVSIPNLPGSTKLYWKVAADYGLDSVLWSEIWYFTTSSTPKALPPILVSPPILSTKNIEGELVWEPVQNAISYRVIIAPAEDSLQAILDTVVEKATSCIYKNLEYKKMYYWRVKTITNSDSSNWSAAWNFHTQPSKPKLVLPLNEALLNTCNPTLEWNPVAEYNFYNLQVGRDSLFNTIVLEFNDLTTNSFVCKELKYNTEYFWRVRYCVNGDWKSWSNVFSFNTVSEYPLDTPELISPADSSYGVPVDGTLYWKEVANAKTYRATISYNTEFDEIFVRRLGIAATEFNYSGLDYNHLYYWRITAFNDTVSGHWSQIRSFTTELMQPKGEFPSDNALNQAVTGIISWTSSPHADKYRLQISEDVGFQGDFLEQVVENDTNYFYSLSHSKQYYWRIKAENSLNMSRWSKINSFATIPATSVNEDFENEYILVYPIPASDVLHLAGMGLSGKEYSICSLQGIVQSSGVIYGSSIDISGINPGWYYLTVCSRKYKFIKM